MDSNPKAKFDSEVVVAESRPTNSHLPHMIIITTAVAAIVFVLDVLSPLGVAGGVPYVILVLLGKAFQKKSSILVLAGLASFLTILGFFLSPEGGVGWVVLINRTYALVAIWGAAIALWWLSSYRVETTLQLREQSWAGNKGFFVLMKENAHVVALLIIIVLSSSAVIYRIKERSKVDIATSLNSALEATQSILQTQFARQKDAIKLWAGNAQIQMMIEGLLEFPVEQEALINAQVQSDIRAWLAPRFTTTGYRGFFVINRDNVNLSSSRDNNIGDVNLLVQQDEFLKRVWSGETLISLPQVSDVPLMDIEGEVVDNLATMFVATLVENAAGEALAILAFRIEPDEAFSEIFHAGRFGDSGETYAFDNNAVMISESRFNDHLKQIGLIPQNKHSILNVEIRDPGVNMVLGHKPVLPRGKQSMTLMAKSATVGKSGSNLDGYRDYRGVPVVGVWDWDVDLGFGITSEVDVQEAFATFYETRFIILVFSGLSIGILILLAVASSYSRKRVWEGKIRADIASRAKSDLMANMSHELRTPLNAIIGFSQVLKEGTFGPLANEKQIEYIDDIHHSGSHLLELINDILDVSAIEAGALEIHEENINISQIIEASVRLIKPRAEDSKVSVLANIKDGLPIIRADERRVKQILLNLLSNSVKFTPEGGRVFVNAWLNEDGSLALSVSDTGIGMDQAEQKTALSMFGQVDSGLDRKQEGTGLGLPLTKGLIELHQGTLEIENKNGPGTLITVTFPKERIGQNH